MKIVIDVPEEEYNTRQLLHYFGCYSDKLDLIIYNGTPLPKRHGRLIDADELKTLSYEVLVDTDNPNRIDGLSVCNGIVEDDIDLAPTVIERSDDE